MDRIKMRTATIEAEKRVIFLDNLRWLLVTFVIFEHASNAYRGLVWWPVADTDTSIIAIWMSAFSDALAMPLLFFVAGFFAIPSIEKKGVLPFLKGKLRRLGIPWLVCMLTICPILPLIYHFTRDGLSLSTSYWELWVVLFQHAAEFNCGLIVSMDALMRNDQFYQRYMWFISLLILFFFIFSLLYVLRKTWFARIDPTVSSQNPSVSMTLKVLSGVGLITTIFSFLTTGAILALGPKSSNPEPLFTLFNIIQFRPTRLIFFIVYFGLGLLTYRNRWIERGRFPGHFKTWAIAFAGLLVVYLFLHHQMRNGPSHLEEMFGMLFFLALNFLTMATLGFLTSLGVRYWNRPTAFGETMAANSYGMYLSHYIFVLIFQLFLFSLPDLPAVLKFGVVSALSVVCAYFFSHFCINRFPHRSIIAALVLAIFMVVWIRP